MPSINPYLNFPGTSEEAFNFYKSVLGGEFATLQRFKDTPGCEKMSTQDQEKIMHISLPIGGKDVLMATDAVETMGFSLAAGNNFYIAISPDTEEQAHHYFNGLSAGGTIEMPLQNMFWGALYGSFTDKYGIKWMVNYENGKEAK